MSKIVFLAMQRNSVDEFIAIHKSDNNAIMLINSSAIYEIYRDLNDGKTNVHLLTPDGCSKSVKTNESVEMIFNSIKKNIGQFILLHTRGDNKPYVLNKSNINKVTIPKDGNTKSSAVYPHMQYGNGTPNCGVLVSENVQQILNKLK